MQQQEDWRISYVNKDYSICSSYPSAVVVPKSVDDDVLIAAASFRVGGRFPVLSYRHEGGVSCHLIINMLQYFYLFFFLFRLWWWEVVSLIRDQMLSVVVRMKNFLTVCWNQGCGVTLLIPATRAQHRPPKYNIILYRKILSKYLKFRFKV